MANPKSEALIKKGSMAKADLFGMYMASGLLQGIANIQQNKAQEAIETMQAGFERLSIQSRTNAVDQQANIVRTNAMRSAMQVSQQGAQAKGDLAVSQAVTASSVGDLMSAANMQEAMALQQVATQEQQAQLELNIQKQQLDTQLLQLNLTQDYNRKQRSRENFGGLLSGVLQGAMGAYTKNMQLGLT